eukprot:232725-Amphidinium_carterae.1
MDDWHRIDNQIQSMLWLDHSISAWATTATQWHSRIGEYVTVDNGVEMTIAHLCAKGACRNLRKVCKHYKHNATLLNAIGSSDMAHNGQTVSRERELFHCATHLCADVTADLSLEPMAIVAIVSKPAECA